MINEFKDIDALSPSDFEIFIRDLFVASGWTEAEITKVGKEFKYGDGGVDIFAYKGKRKFAIEVKQRSLHITVDVKALNQLVTGANLANVTNKILVTNSYFTSEVKARALKPVEPSIFKEHLNSLFSKSYSKYFYASIARLYAERQGWFRMHSTYSINNIPFKNINTLLNDVCVPNATTDENILLLQECIAITREAAVIAFSNWGGAQEA